MYTLCEDVHTLCTHALSRYGGADMEVANEQDITCMTYDYSKRNLVCGTEVYSAQTDVHMCLRV